MMTETVRNAYRIVLNDILNNDCEMFVGKYDAKNGNAKFMHGIGTVIGYIAYNVSDEDGYAIENLFVKNMIESEQKAQGIKCYKCAELSGCWKGQHGGQKKLCLFFTKRN